MMMMLLYRYTSNGSKFGLDLYFRIQNRGQLENITVFINSNMALNS